MTPQEGASDLQQFLHRPDSERWLLYSSVFFLPETTPDSVSARPLTQPH